MHSQPHMANIRSASRDLVRELGFMSRTLAGTALPPSAVHAIIEIGTADGLSSKALCDLLLLEKSTVSRLVGSLRNKGLVRDARSQDDGRSKCLHLTDLGKQTAAKISTFAEQQVVQALQPLSRQQWQAIEHGLKTYAEALKAGRRDSSPPRPPVVIKRGYAPGLIGRIVELHIAYYSELAGFSETFEISVARGLADLVARLNSPDNALWRIECGGRIVGGIAIDGEDLGGGVAHLRYFILDEEIRGIGLGKALMEKALAFCDEREFTETHLWTFKGLDAARRLYESHGFELVAEYGGDQWGMLVREQKFIRPGRG